MMTLKIREQRISSALEQAQKASAQVQAAESYEMKSRVALYDASQQAAEGFRISAARRQSLVNSEAALRAARAEIDASKAEAQQLTRLSSKLQEAAQKQVDALTSTAQQRAAKYRESPSSAAAAEVETSIKRLRIAMAEESRLAELVTECAKAQNNLDELRKSVSDARKAIVAAQEAQVALPFDQESERAASGAARLPISATALRRFELAMDAADAGEAAITNAFSTLAPLPSQVADASAQLAVAKQSLLRAAATQPSLERALPKYESALDHNAAAVNKLNEAQRAAADQPAPMGAGATAWKRTRDNLISANYASREAERLRSKSTQEVGKQLDVLAPRVPAQMQRKTSAVSPFPTTTDAPTAGATQDSSSDDEVKFEPVPLVLDTPAQKARAAAGGVGNIFAATSQLLLAGVFALLTVDNLKKGAAMDDDDEHKGGSSPQRRADSVPNSLQSFTDSLRGVVRSTRLGVEDASNASRTTTPTMSGIIDEPEAKDKPIDEAPADAIVDEAQPDTADAAVADVANASADVEDLPAPSAKNQRRRQRRKVAKMSREQSPTMDALSLS